MSEDNIEDESLEQLAKKKLKKDLESEESPEQIKLERDELKLRMASLALKDFESEIDKTLEKIPESKREKIREQIEKSGDQPATLESIKAQIAMNEPEDDGREKVPPLGVAKAYKPSPKEKVSDLYDILSSNTSTVEEKRVANKKLDELWHKSLSNKKVAKRAIREITEGE